MSFTLTLVYLPLIGRRLLARLLRQRRNLSVSFKSIAAFPSRFSGCNDQPLKMLFFLGTNITVMRSRHSSRVKLVAISLALLTLQANAVRAQGSNPDPPANLQVSSVTSSVVCHK